MGHATSAFNSLLLITVLAGVVPVLLGRMRFLSVPIVVGEIIAGMIVGRSGFDIVEQTPILKFLAEFGFTFLMFLSGLEVNMRALSGSAPGAQDRPRWLQPLPLGFLMLALTLALATAAGYGIAAAGMARNGVLMGLILSTTSLGIVMPILKERKLTASFYGQTLLVAALLADFTTLLLLGFTISIVSEGFKLDLLFFIALLALFVAAAKLSRWISRIPGVPRLLDDLSQATSQFRVRGAFALMMICVVLADRIGVELILGAFLAGAILSAGSRREVESPLREKLDAIGYGFFIPIFFINVGAKFDLAALMASHTALLLVPILIVTAFAVKLLPALLLRFLFPWRETLAAGVLLSARLSLIIAASAIALDLGIIATATNSAIILVAIITCTFAPIIFARILPPAPDEQREGVVIVGTDQLAMLLGQRLQRAGEEAVFVGRDQVQLAHIAEAGFRIAPGNPDDETVLAAAGLETARALVAVTSASDVVLSACRSATKRFKVPVVIARADDPQLLAELQALDVRVVQPALATALALEGALHFPAAFGMLMNQQDGVDVLDVPLRNPAIAGRPLRRVRLPGDALVLGIQRQGEVVVPNGDTVLRLGDTLVLVGNPEALREATRALK